MFVATTQFREMPALFRLAAAPLERSDKLVKNTSSSSSSEMAVEYVDEDAARYSVRSVFRRGCSIVGLSALSGR